MFLPFTIDELEEAVANGDVTKRPHPTMPYFIYNYSPETQYSKKWNRVTLSCRGLILDEDYNIVARPWEKFFNLGEVELPIQFDTPVEIMDKADGSLGIMYPAGEGYAIATRGSFQSEQAKAGSKIWNESYSDIVVTERFTFLFEILLPWNRIVLNYDYDSEYLQQGRGSLSQRSARNDSGEYVYPTEERLEDLPSLQVGGSKAQSAEESRAFTRELPSLAEGEYRTFSGTGNADLQEDSGKDFKGEEGQALHGLRTDISTGMHGLRPPTGNGEEVQYRSGQESTRLGRGNGEVRTSLRELSQDSYIHHTPGNLVLLGAVENRTGYYHGPREAAAYLNWNGPVVETYGYNTISDALGQMGRKNKEGYVIRSHNFMVKVKEPDYLELHRLVSNMTPKTIWEQLKAGKSVAQICMDLPDEFHSQVEDIARPLQARYAERLGEVLSVYANTMAQAYKSGNEPSRKDFAKAFSKSPDKRYFFRLLDGGSINDILWTELKPKEMSE